MEIKKVKTRSTIFTYDCGDWNLNLHLIKGEHYNYIIDTGLGSLSVQPILDLLKDDTKPIRFINTHYHWDHIWGNCALKDSVIISHCLCRELILEKWDYMKERNGQFMSGDVKQCLPGLVFTEELYFPEDGIRLIHTPGHTPDSISVIDEIDGVINVADNIGDTMEEIVPSIYGDMEQYLNSLQKYMTFDIDTYISGHNNVLSNDVLSLIWNEVNNRNFE